MRTLALTIVFAFTAGESTLAGAQAMRGEIIGAVVEHRLTTGQTPERELGAAFGAALSGPVMGWMEVRGHLIGGALSARTPQTDDRRFGELDLAALIVPFSWLAFEVGATSRTFSGALGRQRWLTMRVGAEVRVELLDGRAGGTLGGTLMPVASASGIESPSVAIGAGSAITYSHRDVTARLAYEIERYDFPASAGARRLEQFSRLAGSVGVLLPELRWPLR